MFKGTSGFCFYTTQKGKLLVNDDHNSHNKNSSPNNKNTGFATNSSFEKPRCNLPLESSNENYQANRM